MKFVQLVFTDGRKECLERTLASAEELIEGVFQDKIIVNDCLHLEYMKWLYDTYGDSYDIRTNRNKLGFGGTINRAWQTLPDYGDDTWIFHLEDDFTFNRSVPLGSMVSVLKNNPHLAQMALKRQPWNEQEKAAGGIIERMPEEYTEVTNEYGLSWCEHRLFFTTNPSVYNISLTKRGWPETKYSEGVFSIELFKDPEKKSAFWGKKFDSPHCYHIGIDRVGTGY
jgi:hypothetical protein